MFVPRETLHKLHIAAAALQSAPENNINLDDRVVRVKIRGIYILRRDANDKILSMRNFAVAGSSPYICSYSQLLPRSSTAVLSKENYSSIRTIFSVLFI